MTDPDTETILTEDLIGASVWEDGLYRQLLAHMRNEGRILEQYVQSAKESESKAFAYLVGILVADERKHHEHMADLAASLKHDAELRPGEPTVPYIDFASADRERVLELTEQLLDQERADGAELRRLHRQLRMVKDTTLWDLLITMMLKDSEKHTAILEFVRDHTPKRPR